MKKEIEMDSMVLMIGSIIIIIVGFLLPPINGGWQIPWFILLVMAFAVKVKEWRDGE